MVETITPKKLTPVLGDVLPRVLAVAEDIYTFFKPDIKNALVPILLTEFGIIIDFNDEQP